MTTSDGNQNEYRELVVLDRRFVVLDDGHDRYCRNDHRRDCVGREIFRIERNQQ